MLMLDPSSLKNSLPSQKLIVLQGCIISGIACLSALQLLVQVADVNLTMQQLFQIVHSQR